MKLDAALISGGLPRGDVSALAGKVREITGRAAALTDQDERRTLYGELLSTCAGCHALVRRHREASGSH
jgi:cytochrome c553